MYTKHKHIHSVSLSSLDSEEQESLRAERFHNRSSRNSTGGISTHSLNEAELAVCKTIFSLLSIMFFSFSSFFYLSHSHLSFRFNSVFFISLHYYSKNVRKHVSFVIEYTRTHRISVYVKSIFGSIVPKSTNVDLNAAEFDFCHISNIICCVYDSIGSYNSSVYSSAHKPIIL